MRIVQDNERASRALHPNGTLINTIQVYSDAPKVELFSNGHSQGVVDRSRYMWAEWDSVPYEAGNLTAVALSEAGEPLASHSVITAGVPSALVLSVDAPSPLTGTGTKLLLDGQDTALIRATVVDADGHTVPLSTNNVTFEIVSGPGRVLGVGNGDPTNHEPNQATWRSAFHGLVRGVVQVTLDASSPSSERAELLAMDIDGGVRTQILDPHSTSAPTTIVVRASSLGLQSAELTINLSVDSEQDGVLAVAARSVNLGNTAA